MRHIKNDKGIALVMVLVLAFLALSIVSGLLFMVTQSTRLSGYHRFFRTAEEAGIGGTEIAAEFIINRGSPFTWTTTSTSSLNCLTQKFNTPRLGTWSTIDNWNLCVGNDALMDPTINPDLRFNLPNPQTTFGVFVKIVDTVEGNSASGALITGGGALGGAGVVAASTGIVNPPHNPFLYRLEIQSQNANNPREVSRFSGLYAY